MRRGILAEAEAARPAHPRSVLQRPSQQRPRPKDPPPGGFAARIRGRTRSPTSVPCSAKLSVQKVDALLVAHPPASRGRIRSTRRTVCRGCEPGPAKPLIRFSAKSRLVIVKATTMKRRSASRTLTHWLATPILTVCLLAQAGCMTRNLWDQTYFVPARPADIRLYESQEPPGVLVEYNERIGGGRPTGRRAYLLQTSVGLPSGSPPPFLQPSGQAAGLKSIPFVKPGSPDLSSTLARGHACMTPRFPRDMGPAFPILQRDRIWTHPMTQRRW